MTTATTTKVKTLHIEYDQDTESPCDWDGSWKHISFSRKHINYEDPWQYVEPNIGLRRKLQVGLAFYLSYYEHGSGTWSLKGEGMQCQWDTAQMAGILIWEHEPKDMGAKTYEERSKDARGFLETYNDWANGNCYYFRIEDADGETIDSCGGFIGSDHLESGLNDVLTDEDRYVVDGDAAWLAEYMTLNGEVADEDDEAYEEAA